MGETKRIGRIGNYYGGLIVKEKDGKFFFGVHDATCSTCFEEINEDLFTALCKHGGLPKPTVSLTHAEIVEGGVCADCGYPAIKTTTNDNHPMSYQGWDYWLYCTNKGCKNHDGAGYAQCNPEWFVPVVEFTL